MLSRVRCWSVLVMTVGDLQAIRERRRKRRRMAGIRYFAYFIAVVLSGCAGVPACCPLPCPLPAKFTPLRVACGDPEGGAGEFGCVPWEAMVRPGDRTSLKAGGDACVPGQTPAHPGNLIPLSYYQVHVFAF